MARTWVSLAGWVRTIDEVSKYWNRFQLVAFGKGHPCKQKDSNHEGRNNFVSGYHTVDVSCAAGVVTWEGGLHLDNTLPVTLLNTSVEGVVEVSLIIRVAVSTGDDSRIDTLWRLM